MEKAEYRRPEPFVSGCRMGILTLLACLVSGFMLLAAGHARAAGQPFEIEFDRSEVKIGALGDLGGLGNLPLGTAGQEGSISGSWNPATGQVTVPKGKFILPQPGIDDPVKLRLFMGIEAPATGTFNPTTGALELHTEAGLWVTVDAGALLDLLGLDIGDLPGGSGGTGGLNIGSLVKPFLSNLTCGFSPMDVHFTTGSNSLSAGTPFTDGPRGKGAITAEWSRLGRFSGRTKLPVINLDPCLLIRDMLPGLIEDGAGGALPGGVDLGGLDLGRLLDGINDLDLGPSSITLTRSVAAPEPHGKPGNPDETVAGRPRLKIKVTALDRKVKRPWKPRYRVRVKNTGNGKASGIRACLFGFSVKAACFKLGTAGAGKVKTKTIRAHVVPQRLRIRRQRVLRPLVTITARSMKPVKRRQRTTVLIEA